MATKGIVKGIVSNLVTVEVDGPVSQNEICYISVGGVKLMAEVIKVIGKNAFVQVFESTRGILSLLPGWATRWPPVTGWVKWTKTSNLTRSWSPLPSKANIR